jgi:radical SAM protein with 4Fe4S-binding SPASM domain
MASGDVYSCSAYLLDPRFKLGNIGSSTFREVWEGEPRRANWEFVRRNLDISECRLNCRMHKSNEYLDALAKGVEHQNFV